MDPLGGIGFIEHIDVHPLANSGPQHRPRELIVVRGSYYLSSMLAVTLSQLDLTLADAQHVPAGFPGKSKRIQDEEARQLQKGPASELAE
jgi:hypothetical protein